MVLSNKTEQIELLHRNNSSLICSKDLPFVSGIIVSDSIAPRKQTKAYIYKFANTPNQFAINVYPLTVLIPTTEEKIVITLEATDLVFVSNSSDW